MKTPNEDSQLVIDRKKRTESEQWRHSNFRKICVYVNSESDLEELYSKAKEAGLDTVMIANSGYAEFNWVPTQTCIVNRPHAVKKDKIT